jgi:hypothetical protein
LLSCSHLTRSCKEFQSRKYARYLCQSWPLSRLGTTRAVLRRGRRLRSIGRRSRGGLVRSLPADLPACARCPRVEAAAVTGEDRRSGPLNFSWRLLWHWPRDLGGFNLLYRSRFWLRCRRSLLPPCRWCKSCRRCWWRLICQRHRLLRRSVATIGIDSRVSDIYVAPDDLVACAGTGRGNLIGASHVVVNSHRDERCCSG